jgi:hypothetical protein
MSGPLFLLPSAPALTVVMVVRCCDLQERFEASRVKRADPVMYICTERDPGSFHWTRPAPSAAQLQTVCVSRLRCAPLLLPASFVVICADLC